MHLISRTLILVTFVLAGCSSGPKRVPAALDQVQEGVNEDIQKMHSFPHTEEWESHETEENQHTFIQLGNEGKFGYHVSLLNTNHQHQVIVASELKIQGSNDVGVRKQLSKKAMNGYFTVLTDKPRFSLIEIRDKRKTVIPVDLYDGIIGIDNETKISSDATYTIKKILFKTQMQPEDTPLTESRYIVIGNPDDKTAQDKYFIIHLMWGGSTYDQVMEVKLDKPMVIPNASILTIKRADTEPLPMEAGIALEGNLADNTPVPFKVVRQIHFRFL